MEHLIKVTVFITSFDSMLELRDVLTKNYEGHFPASSLIGVSALFSPEVNIEIEMVFATQK